jgi:thiol:disulfide interchange protein
MSKILHKPEVEAALSRFVVAKLDCTKPEYKSAKIKREKYKAPFMPYMIFYDSKGNFLKELSFEGKTSKREFLERLKKIK